MYDRVSFVKGEKNCIGYLVSYDPDDDDYTVELITKGVGGWPRDITVPDDYECRATSTFCYVYADLVKICYDNDEICDKLINKYENERKT